MTISTDEIRNQSLNAYNQWKDKWRKHAEIHSKYEMKSLNDFMNIGTGKACLVVANGRSFQDKIDIIRDNQKNVDILACDKTIGNLLENGIVPKYCLVCDASVSYEKYLKRWENELQDTILFINACGNPEWSEKGNWKDKYFFINMDILKSEREFSKISGCKNFIPAGTNVSNAMIVFLTQCDNTGRRNFFGYDKMILIGFDYGWKENKYYAFDNTGYGKDNYQRSVYLKDNKGNLCFSSNNLVFSARWFEQYIKTFNLPVVQCSDGTIIPLQYSKDLESQMQYRHKINDCKIVRHLTSEREKLSEKLDKVKKEIQEIGKDHFWAYRASI